MKIRNFLINGKFIYVEYTDNYDTDFGKRDCSFAEIIDLNKKYLITVRRNSSGELWVDAKGISQNKINDFYLNCSTLKKLSDVDDISFNFRNINARISFISGNNPKVSVISLGKK